MKRRLFNSIIAMFGGTVTYLFGGWDTPLIVLIGFMSLDYITGLLSAWIRDVVNSQVGFKGIARKATILAVLILSVLLDRLINNGTWVFRTLVCYFYIANEGISILENIAKTGIPIPKKLLNALEQLKKQEE